MIKNLPAELYSLLVRSISDPDLLNLESEANNVAYLSSQNMIIKIGGDRGWVEEGWIVTGQTINELANGTIRRIEGWDTL